MAIYVRDIHFVKDVSFESLSKMGSGGQFERQLQPRCSCNTWCRFYSVLIQPKPYAAPSFLFT